MLSDYLTDYKAI